jgi:aerobic carbon-monoxide dehydrogenase medium subunit
MPAVPFAYHTPATLTEALEVLHTHAGDARPLAGGQSLVPMLTLRLVRPAVVVDLHPLTELRTVRRDNGVLEIGALVRHRALERGEGLLGACPLLQEAASLIGNVRVRTLGTIGGSLAHADPAAELPAVVRALDGTLVLRGREGERTIPAQDFFVDMLTTALRPGELLVAVRLPVLGPRAGFAVEEFSRRPGDFAIVAAVAVVELDPAGRVARARVALAGVGPTPRRLAGVEDALAGVQPSGETFRKVLEGRPLEIEPDSDVHASAAYRRHLARVLTARALERAGSAAAGRARG